MALETVISSIFILPFCSNKLYSCYLLLTCFYIFIINFFLNFFVSFQKFLFCSFYFVVFYSLLYYKLALFCSGLFLTNVPFSHQSLCDPSSVFYPCDQCSSVFPSSSQLKTHSRQANFFTGFEFMLLLFFFNFQASI